MSLTSYRAAPPRVGWMLVQRDMACVLAGGNIVMGSLCVFHRRQCLAATYSSIA